MSKNVRSPQDRCYRFAYSLEPVTFANCAYSVRLLSVLNVMGDTELNSAICAVFLFQADTIRSGGGAHVSTAAPVISLDVLSPFVAELRGNWVHREFPMPLPRRLRTRQIRVPGR